MTEYLSDGIGFYHEQAFAHDGVVARPFTFIDEQTVYDTPHLAWKRENNRERVAAFAHREKAAKVIFSQTCIKSLENVPRPRGKEFCLQFRRQT